MPTPSPDEIFAGFEKRAGKGKLLARLSRGAHRVGKRTVTNKREMDRISAGYRRAATQGMPESFIAELPIMAAEKVTGKGKVRSKVYDYISKPAQDVDTAVGRQLERIPIIGRAFRAEERIPWGSAGEKTEKVITRSSAVAPLTKAKNFVAPLIIAGGLERGVRAAMPSNSLKAHDKTASFGDMMDEVEIRKVAQAEHMDRQVREKVASTMLRLHKANKEHEKQAQALRLIYKKAELGLEAVPQSYDDLVDKVASVMGQDMATLEKALELTAGGSSFGELASGESAGPSSAQETFQSDVLS